MALAGELMNVIAHYFLRDNSSGIHWIDLVSFGITAAVVFVTARTVSRNLNKLALGIVAGLFVWICSVVFVILISAIKPTPALTAGEPTEGIVGLLISAVLTVPLVIAVSALGGALGRRRHGQSG